MFAFFGFLLFCVFGFMTARERRLRRQAWSSRHWLPTEGKVIDVSDNSFSIDSVNQYTPATKTKYYEDLLTISYQVDGEKYVTTNYSFGAHVDQPFEMHRVGDRVTVFYNPNEPGNAVVNKGMTFSLLLSPIFTLIGLIWVIQALMRSW
jgi:hypothetical protein